MFTVLILLAALGTLLLICIAAYLYFRSRSPSVGLPAVAKLHGPGKYEFNIVGESHYQAVLESICGGRSEESARKETEAYLYLEKNNKYDSLAVRVDIEGNTVGYLSKPDARSYRKQLADLGHTNLVGFCSAIVVGGWYRSSSDSGHFGVKLDLPVN
jgi:hypothetical protein